MISQLTAKEFTGFVAGGCGSIRNTMVHLLSTEWGWLSRCGGHQRGASLEADDYPRVEPLLKDWEKVEGYMHEFLSQLGDDDLHRNIEYRGKGDKKCSMPLGELLHHSIFMEHTIGGRLLYYYESSAMHPVVLISFFIMQKNTVCRHGKY